MVATRRTHRKSVKINYEESDENDSSGSNYVIDPHVSTDIETEEISSEVEFDDISNIHLNRSRKRRIVERTNGKTVQAKVRANKNRVDKAKLPIEEDNKIPSDQLSIVNSEYKEDESSVTMETMASNDINENDVSSEDSVEEDPAIVEARILKRKEAVRKAKATRDRKVYAIHPSLGEVWKEVDLITMVKRLDTNHKMQEHLEGAMIDQPELLKLKLLPFQREGVSWLIQQEETIFNGGILADEMGMGKTIQMLALILSDLPDKAITLVICPTVALGQWQTEIQTHTQPDTLKVLIYHGGNRVDNVNELHKHHVVITTYAVLESEHRRETKGYQLHGKHCRDKSLLHAIQWDRVILDEAHNIKDRSCSTAKAAFRLDAKSRWSLSGTPLQNRVGELYSLIRFIKTFPYSYYFCSKCPCQSLAWKFSDYRSCDECGHKPMSHFCWWNREILRPIQKYGSQGDGRVAFVKLGHLLNKIMLRRTKLERASDLGLPPKVVRQRGCFFNDEEMDFYESMYGETRTKFMAYVNEGTVLNHYAHIFDLLMKMRQAANHPFLVLYGRNKSMQHVDVCGVCQEEAEDPISAQCKHVFCREDIKLYISSATVGSDQLQCPVCFIPLTIDLDQPTIVRSERIMQLRAQSHQSILNRMDIGGWRSSTKIEALIEELSKLRSRDCTIKSIVFSQFVSFLDIIEWRLLRCGFRCVKLDGRMLPCQRDGVINAFMTNPVITVFLVSLKAGGVALNLTEASRVFIMDPWWNPAVEDQAMDRIHRLGQYRPIEVIRIIVENSIESRIIELQKKKHLLFQSTVGMDLDALNRLTEDDLQFLFSL